MLFGLVGKPHFTEGHRGQITGKAFAGNHRFVNRRFSPLLHSGLKTRFTSGPKNTMSNAPITFPNWKEVLAQASLSPQLKAALAGASSRPGETALASLRGQGRQGPRDGPARKIDRGAADPRDSFA